MPISLDTHFYDNTKLYDILEKNKFQIDNKKDMISSLKNKLQSREAISFFDAIIKESQTPSNFHRVYADDLLLIISSLIDQCNEKELIRVLTEQLQDMKTGFCVQGKCNRLLQVIEAFQLNLFVHFDTKLDNQIYDFYKLKSTWFFQKDETSSLEDCMKYVDTHISDRSFNKKYIMEEINTVLEKHWNLSKFLYICLFENLINLYIITL